MGDPRIHLLFEVAGVIAAAITYFAIRKGDPLPGPIRMRILAGAGLGATIGARLLFWLCDPALTIAHITDPAYLFGGKTVVGGLLGGLIGVEWIKKIDGVTRSTGDAFVYPLIAAIAFGRVGCFLYGPADHTYGDPTSLPWGIAIVDGVKRHPVALYEIAFLLIAGALLTRVRGREGDRFRLFLASYLSFRLAVDFIKPEPPRMFGGMSAIQWACIAGLVYYAATFVTRALERRTTYAD